MSSLLRKCLKWVVRIYIAIATCVGTALMAWPFIVIGYNGFMAPAPMPIHLPNGFIYDVDWEATRGVPHLITDDSKRSIVMPDVLYLMWHEQTIYGFRRGRANEPYYFLCTYNKDCSHTQHLSEPEFLALIKQMGLPEYDSYLAKSYDQLLRERPDFIKPQGG